MPEDIRRLLTTELAPDTERWWMSWAEQVREKEEARWLVKMRRQVVLLLQLKFDTLPEGVVQRVDVAFEEELDRITEHIPTANTLEALLARALGQQS